MFEWLASVTYTEWESVFYAVALSASAIFSHYMMRQAETATALNKTLLKELEESDNNVYRLEAMLSAKKKGK